MIILNGQFNQQNCCIVQILKTGDLEHEWRVGVLDCEVLPDKVSDEIQDWVSQITEEDFAEDTFYVLLETFFKERGYTIINLDWDLAIIG